MSILDSILNRYDAPARIVSEQHDADRINTGGETPTGRPSDGLRRQIDSLKDGGWDAAEYGISLAAQVAKLEAALARAIAYEATPEGMEAARLEVERAISEMRARALRRASLDTSNGRVNAMFAGRPAWHGLGVVVDRAATSAEAIRLAGLDWQVKKVPLAYQWDGKTVDTDDVFAVVRADTGAKLGTVGRVYRPVQNTDGFDLDSVLAQYGARYDSAGSVFGGKRIWMLANMPEQRFEVQPGDAQEPYVLFSNCHDGSGAAWCLPTAVRVECANTLRIAVNGKGQKALSIRHTGNVKDKIAAAQDALGLAVESFGSYRQAAEQMVKATCEVRHYANDVLDAVLDITAADTLAGAGSLVDAMLLTDDAERELAHKSIERKIARRGEVLSDILERYDSERCTPRGSVWAAFNAVTEHADHGNGKYQSRDQETRMSRRFESVLVGDADEMKQVAYQKAVAAL